MRIQDVKIDLEEVRRTLCKSKQELQLYANNKDMRMNISDCFSVVIDVVAKAEEKVYRVTGDAEYNIQPYEDRIYRKGLNDSRSAAKQLVFVKQQVDNQYSKLDSINKSKRFINADNTLVSLESGTFDNSLKSILALSNMLTDIMNEERYK